MALGRATRGILSAARGRVRGALSEPLRMAPSRSHSALSQPWPRAHARWWPAAALCGGAALLASGGDALCERLVPNRPLFEAALAGKTDEVHRLIGDGASPDGFVDDNGVTALIGASNNGHAEVVRLLLLNGADPDLQAPKGSSPLMMASGEGHTRVVRLLLNHGATPDLTNKNGVSALIWASSRGQLGAVAALLDAGASLDLQDRSGVTSLMAASVMGHVEVVRILLGDGAGTNLRDRAGRTALDFAERDPLSKLEASRKEAKEAVAQLLRAHGAKKSSIL
jgi:ankyrin repeat protein